MSELIMGVAIDVFANLLQLIISSVVSLFVYYKLIKRVKVQQTGFLNDLLVIAGAAFLGLSMPMNTFAMLPIIYVLLNMGFRVYTVLPIIFSNIVFNMLVPFTDPTFIWKTGFKRIIAAFLLGLIAGNILRSLSNKKEVFRINEVPVYFNMKLNLKAILGNIHQNISVTGLYLLAGAIFNIIFYKYIYYNLISGIFSNTHTAGMPLFFARYNVVHPLFLLAINITYSLLNFTNLSAVPAILKPKSFALFICYYAVWSILLGTSMFIHN